MGPDRRESGGGGQVWWGPTWCEEAPEQAPNTTQPFVEAHPHYPLDPPSLQVVATQMQATATLKRQLVSKGQPCEHIRSDAWGVISHIYKEDGLSGFWKGERGGWGLEVCSLWVQARVVVMEVHSAFTCVITTGFKVRMTIQRKFGLRAVAMTYSACARYYGNHIRVLNQPERLV